MEKSTPLQFIVPDIDCESCVTSITEAVRQLDSEASVTADLATKHVVVDSHKPAEEITRAIESAGFSVEGVAVFALTDPHAGEHGKQDHQHDDEHDDGDRPAQH